MLCGRVTTFGKKALTNKERERERERQKDRPVPSSARTDRLHEQNDTKVNPECAPRQWAASETAGGSRPSQGKSIRSLLHATKKKQEKHAAGRLNSMQGTNLQMGHDDCGTGLGLREVLMACRVPGPHHRMTSTAWEGRRHPPPDQNLPRPNEASAVWGLT